jgi:Flp pilus assembly protein TadG
VIKRIDTRVEMRRRKDERGVALVVVALSMVVLMGFLALGIDVGTLRYQKRLQQTAADAAALAGASNLAYNSGVILGAQNASAANGFTDNGGGVVSACGSSAAVGTVCVQVDNPPLSGPHTGSSGYVEVLVAAVHPTYFAKIMGINKETVTARAVAANVGGNNGCAYALNPNTAGIEGIAVQGHADLNGPTCAIVDNGNLDLTGNAYTVESSTTGVSGTVSGKTSNVTCTTEPTDCPATGVPPSGDPMSYLTPPAVGTPVNFDPSNIIAGTTYNGISITGNGTVNFPAGTYIVDGGSFTCHGTPTITGTGVTFYFTNGATIDCSGTDNIQFSAPASGPYAGILFYQDPNDTVGPTLGGNTGSFFDGAVYFPSSQVTFSGNTSFSIAMVVAGSIALAGNPTVNLQGSAGLPSGVSLVANAVLVE